MGCHRGEFTCLYTVSFIEDKIWRSASDGDEISKRYFSQCSQSFESDSGCIFIPSLGMKFRPLKGFIVLGNSSKDVQVRSCFYWLEPYSLGPTLPEGWQSGRSRRSWKPLGRKVSGVRIPPLPPFLSLPLMAGSFKWLMKPSKGYLLSAQIVGDLNRSILFWGTSQRGFKE